MKISKLLNIFGMTAAFAALYIILVQVHYDLTYNVLYLIRSVCI